MRGGTEGAEATSSSLKNLSEFKSNLKGTDSTIDGFKVFAHDAEKQGRFDKYRELLKGGEKNRLSSLQPLSMTEWERDHEAEEFAQAVHLCTPVSSTNESNEAASSALQSSMDPMVNAARAKMFGKLTRAIESWQPSSIVCKRFNIPEPKTGCAKPTDKTKKYSVFESLDFCGDTKFQKATDTAETYKEPHIPYNPPELENPEEVTNAIPIFDTSDIDTRSSKSVEKIRNFEASYGKVFGKNSEEAVEEECVDKPEKQDLFKAIFLSSSEDETDEEDDDNNDTVKSLLIGKAISVTNVQRNDSPPRGIFAELDLDELGRPGVSGKINKDPVSNNETRKLECLTGVEAAIPQVADSEIAMVEMKISPQTYGPALPVKSEDHDSSNPEIVSNSQRPVFRSVVITKLDAGDKSVEWIEKKKSKKERKKKHKHKEKEKEKEKKHKHKSSKSKKKKR